MDAGKDGSGPADSNAAKDVPIGGDVHHLQQQPMHREVDSPDDFEHLGHDISPLKEAGKETTPDMLDGLRYEPPARVTTDKINNVSERVEAGAVNLATKFTGDVDDVVLSFGASQEHVIENEPAMDTNLLEMGDSFPDRKAADEKLDKFLSELASFAPPVPKHQIDATIKEKDEVNKFMALEKRDDKTPLLDFTAPGNNDSAERYTDSDQEADLDDYKPVSGGDQHSQKKGEPLKTEALFKDMHEDVEDLLPELPPKRDLPKDPSPPPPQKPATPSPEPLEPSAPELPPHRAPTPEQQQLPPPPPPKQPSPEPPKKVEPAIIVKPQTPPPPKPEPTSTVEKKIETKPKAAAAAAAPVIDAEAMFCKMGLVESLIYWRDPKKSGPVFGGVLVVLLALTYFSLISVVAYLSLLILMGTISFRIYKNIVQAVQKTGDGHPLKEFLELDISLSQDKVTQLSGVAVVHFNAFVSELRRLFLVEDLIDSIKFGITLWLLTYFGAWFNGMTLIIMTWVALFTLPKVYETNKTQIDANLEIVRSKLAEITSKVKAAIPIGKKVEEKKEQ